MLPRWTKKIGGVVVVPRGPQPVEFLLFEFGNCQGASFFANPLGFGQHVEHVVMSGTRGSVLDSNAFAC